MSLPDPSPFDRFVHPARARNQIWRLVVGVIFVFGTLMLAAVPFREIGQALNAPQPIAIPDDPELIEEYLRDLNNDPVDTLNNQSSTVTTLLFLLFFGVIQFALWLLLPILHKRSFRSLFGPPRLAARQFYACTLPLLGLFALSFLLPPWDFSDLEPNAAFGPWLLMLPFGMAAVLIQTSAEEILFRGYILQQIAARFPARIVWMLVPALLFGALHYTPDLEGSAAWTIPTWAVIFGLATADLTWRSGSLGPAIALHFANNCSALLLISVSDELSGLALFTLSMSLSEAGNDPMVLIIDLMWLLIGWLICRITLRV